MNELLPRHIGIVVTAMALKCIVGFTLKNWKVAMIKTMLASLVLLLFSPSVYSEALCSTHERVSFSCRAGSKSMSVCRNSEDALIYRFGTPQNIELELASDVHFSRTAYSGGGEGHLTFQNGHYRYVVYSSISNGDWLDDGTREKIERAGVYVVEGDELLAEVECQSDLEMPFIHDLPPHDEQEFRYYE